MTYSCITQRPATELGLTGAGVFDAGRPPAPRDGIELTTHHTACYGSCPSYSVSLRTDGSVIYEGLSDVRVKGVVIDVLPPAVVAMLRARFEHALANPIHVDPHSHCARAADSLVRLEMARVAKAAKVEPSRISFVESLRLIRDEWLWLSVTSPGAIPKRLAAMRANMKRHILPPRRPKRLYPRAVKVKMSNYERKRPVVEAGGHEVASRRRAAGGSPTSSRQRR